MIEKESIKLLNAYNKKMGLKLSTPVPVFDIIEYLGYDIDFSKDGIYQGTDFQGGTHIEEKTVVINENIIGYKGWMHFTAAHEIGHIVLHVPIHKSQNVEKESDQKIIRTGRFNNVSKMAMLNRLIGMGLVKGLSYQKASPRNKKRS